LPCFLFKIHNVLETGFCLRLQVKPTQLGSVDRASPYLRGPRLAMKVFQKPAHTGYLHFKSNSQCQVKRGVSFGLTGHRQMNKIIGENCCSVDVLLYFAFYE
jgi:hypothetical protein